MSEYKHLMLDLETMGSTSNSAIVSIGAVEFDLDSGKIGESFYTNVDLQSCMDLGLTLNASTVLWWMEQSEEARKSLKFQKVHILDALTEFTKFCKDKSYTVWGNSARFDCGILSDAYNKLGLPIPWKFSKERCVRTLVSFNPEIKKKYVELNKGIAHNAIDDCKLQIGYCTEIWQSLKNN